MNYTPEHLEPWTPEDPAFGGANNYIGADLSEFYIAPIGYSRDTQDPVTLSNWRVISAELEKVSIHEETGIARLGHWACGWYELFLIHRDDAPALKVADNWAAELAQYPIACEEDCSELEHEQAEESWDSWGRSGWRDVLEGALDEHAPEVSDPYWADEVLDKCDDAALDNCWYEVSKRLNWTTENDGAGTSFNFEGAKESLTTEDLAALTGLVLLPPDQKWRREPYPWLGADPAPLLAPMETI